MSAPRFVANTQLNTISVANPNRDGTGTISTVFTSTKGALIKCVLIQAISNTKQGMIRLYVNAAGSGSALISEIPVPAISPSRTVKAFYTSSRPYITLAAGDSLQASTENGEPFNVVVLADDWDYCNC